MTVRDGWMIFWWTVKLVNQFAYRSMHSEMGNLTALRAIPKPPTPGADLYVNTTFILNTTLCTLLRTLVLVFTEFDRHDEEALNEELAGDKF